MVKQLNQVFIYYSLSSLLKKTTLLYSRTPLILCIKRLLSAFAMLLIGTTYYTTAHTVGQCPK